MSKRYIGILIVIGIAIVSVLVIILVDIKQTYIELGTVKSELNKVTKEFDGYKELVQTVNDIDKRITEGLANAKADNDNLRADVNSGIKRLFVITKTATGSVDDARCELSGEARQAYFDLRNAIVEFTAIAEARKEYINRVCLSD